MHLKMMMAGFHHPIHHHSHSGDELDDENLPLFLPAQPCFEWTGGDTAVTRDIPLMSNADVYIDIVNIVIQSYGANIVHYIYMIETVHGLH